MNLGPGEKGFLFQGEVRPRSQAVAARPTTFVPSLVLWLRFSSDDRARLSYDTVYRYNLKLDHNI